MRVGASVPSCLLAIALLQPIAAQTANGIVLGFDGKPVADAVVSARIGDARTGGVDVPTDANGTFALECLAPITQLWVELAGAHVDVAVVEGQARAVHVTFAAVPHHALQGRIVLPDGAAAVGVEIRCQSPTGETLLSVATDANGEFRTLLGKTPRDIVVDPIGWGHRAKVADGKVLVDLRQQRELFFAISGRVMDDQGPMAASAVRASGDGRVVYARAGADGRYTLWANHPIELLEVFGANPIRRKGPFTATATAIDLDVREHGLVVVTGRVLAADGTPVRDALVFGVERDGPPAEHARAEGKSSPEGWFRVRLPRNAKFVYVWSDTLERGGTAALATDGKPTEVRMEQ